MPAVHDLCINPGSQPASISAPYSTPERQLYLSMLLDYGLVQAQRGQGVDFADNPQADAEPPTSQESFYQIFLDKLAFLLDSDRGGNTVSALAILKGDSGAPEYVFTSNARRESDMSDAKDRLSALLRILKEDKGRAIRLGASKNAPAALRRKLVDRALLANIRRLHVYLGSIDKAIVACLASLPSSRDQSDDIYNELELLRSKTHIRLHIAADLNEEQKFLKECDTLLKALHNARSTGTRIGSVITERASQTDQNQPAARAWSEFRHCMSRLLNYRLAVETIFKAYQRWPALMEDFTVTSVPSSKPWPRPITDRKLTAHDIVSEILPPGRDRDDCSTIARNMAIMGVDDKIQERVGNKNWRPIVHAEMNLHAYILDNDKSHETHYWNEWKYIGSSKPTCRLCEHYFQAHSDDVQVRRSHGNLYTTWRLPVLDEDGLGDQHKDRATLVEDVTAAVMKDLRQTLHDKLIRGRAHDTTTSASLEFHQDFALDIDGQAFSDTNQDDFSSDDDGGSALGSTSGFAESPAFAHVASSSCSSIASRDGEAYGSVCGPVERLDSEKRKQKMPCRTCSRCGQEEADGGVSI
ncbi:hypothetical protein Micbo1qcDRAFT_167044 [Microdochium bolleyi]|uniref:Uncharacterized protein n=1 Tax=Microdochium bolleyi TaxID=196109 RepID=A0A136ISW3_9PEZI|nr:hypothetical protein Micbo1qcDRAFT_167044 [Microdochium bolleyi]